MMNKPRTITSFISVLLPICVFADIASEDETLSLVYGTERMVSIATGSEQLLYKAPAIASVITRQDIERSSANTLNDLLEIIPSLHISTNYSAGDAIYSMRGFFRDPDAGMLFMINGVTINSLQSGSRFSALQLPLNNIEQIEIIRGPGSAVYGADAFVGVINIITRKHQDTQVFGIQSGSFSSNSAWVQNNFALGQWKTHTSIQYQTSKGDNNRRVDNDLQSFLDSISSSNASLAPASLPSAYNVLDAELNFDYKHWNINQWLWMNRDQENDHGIPGLDVIDPNGQLDSRASLSSISYNNNQFSENWSLNARLSFLDYTTDRKQFLLPAGSIAPIGNDGNIFTSGIRNVDFPNGMVSIINSREQQSHAEITAFYYGWTDHSLRLSSGYQQQQYSSDEARNFGPSVLDNNQPTALTQAVDINNPANRSLPDGVRHVRYVSLQDEWDFINDWTLTAGIRYDNYSDFGTTTNPRLALVWQTNYNLSTKLLYGRAFRAPAYKELNLQNQLGFNGNQDLQAETIDTIELAFDYRPNEDLHSNLSLFAQRAKNLIFAVEDTTIANTFTFENSGTQEGVGIEAEMNWRIFPSLEWAANFAWQYNQLLEIDIEAPYAPSKQLYTQVSWQLNHFWQLIPQLHYIGLRPRALGDTRTAVPTSTRVDLSLLYRNHYENWDFSLRIRNLFNEKLYEPSIGNDSIAGGAALDKDIPLQGFNLLAEFRYFIKE